MLARIAVTYVVVAAVNLATRFEWMRWRQVVERERALQRERVELSQAIHDTAAQSAYMIGLGIDTAKVLAGDANPELTATLEATSQLSRSIIWELRHPINMGSIYEGMELSRALRSHATSFTNVTSVPARMTNTGAEPPLSVEDRSLLFSIAHNALTNGYRHAEAGRVSVHLEFTEEDIRLSVSDDGVGLPDDYAIRGSGKAGDAAQVAGLTLRERDILVSFARGMSYARIAEARGINAVTVRNAIYGIQRKLNVRTMQELVLWCVRNGLLDNYVMDGLRRRF